MTYVESSGLEWVRQISEKLAQYLLKQGEHVQYKHHGKPFSSQFGELYRFILMTKDAKSYAIDFNDTDISQLDNTNIDKILKCQYNPTIAYKKSIPYTYFPKNPNLLQAMLPELRSTKRVYQLYFKGKPHEQRDRILKDLEYYFDMPPNETLNIEEYYRDCTRSKLCLSLPGHGNFCHREIECFGMGVPVIMPKLVNQCYNKLIPNIHYLSIEELTAQAIFERYQKITSGELEYISKNALKWFEENVTHYTELALQLLLG
jgi:hypothetical protein